MSKQEAGIGCQRLSPLPTLSYENLFLISDILASSLFKFISLSGITCQDIYVLPFGLSWFILTKKVTLGKGCATMTLRQVLM